MSEISVARAAGQRQQDVSRFFLGQMKFPPLDFLDALARVFHFSLADLLAEELPKPSLSEKQRRILATIRGMQPKQREGFETLLEAPRTGKAGNARRREGRENRGG